MDRKNKNKLYEKQGIHVINTIFTVEDKLLKVLLIKENNDYLLIGGKLYNNEDIPYGTTRELEEKTGLRDIDLYETSIFGKPFRSVNNRIIAIGYVGLVNYEEVIPILEENKKIKLFSINKLPKFGYDHHEIFDSAIKKLRKLIINTNILKEVFPKQWTMVELRNIFETVYNKKLDRRNFRKKVLALGMVEDTKKSLPGTKGRPAKLYKFSKKTKKVETF